MFDRRYNSCVTQSQSLKELKTLILKSLLQQQKQKNPEKKTGKASRWRWAAKWPFSLSPTVQLKSSTLVDLFHSIDVHVQHASNIHIEFKQQKRSWKDGKSPCRYRH